MTDHPEPFTTMLDLASGALEPTREVVERRIADMRGMYLEDDDVDDDRLLYRVNLIPVPSTGDDIFCSTTIMEPGLVGREYHMTKGHFHEVRGRGEVYLGLAGEGRLVLATEDGEWRVEPLRPGTVNYIPGGWAHRSVNVGEDQLVFFAAYIADAGHDYGSIEDEGFPVLVVTGQDGPEVVDNPRYGG
jgi:glucose-6-phosphate isomerase, archaeal